MLLRSDINLASLNEWKEKAQSLRVRIQEAEANMARAKAKMAEHEQNAKATDDKQPSSMSEQKALSAEQTISSVQAEISKIEESIAELENRLRDHLKQQGELVAKISLAKKNIEQYKNAQQLNLAEAELHQIQQAIAEGKARIETISAESTDTKDKFNSVNMRRALAQTSVRQLTERADGLKLSIANYSNALGAAVELKNLADLTEKLEEEQRKHTLWIVEKNAVDMRIKEIRAEIAQQKSEPKKKLQPLIMNAEFIIREELQSSITNYRKLIASYQELHHELSCKLTDHIKTNQFMNDYFTDPAALLHGLYERLNQEVAEYKKQHPLLNDDEVLCLYEYQRAADFIVNGERCTSKLRDDAPTDPQEMIRLRLWQLFGFVYSHQQAYLRKCTGFCNVLSRALRDDVFDEDEAKRKYFDLQLDYSEILDKKPEAKELRLFANESALAAFEQALNEKGGKLPEDEEQLYKSGWKLLNTIKQEVKSNPDGIDAYTNVLTSARTLLTGFADQNAHIALQNCAMLNIDGKYKLGRAVLGMVLVFAGCAAIAASAVVLGVTGGTVPLATFGIVGGMILYAIGVRIYDDARPTGTAKAVMEFQWCAKRASRSARGGGLLFYSVDRKEDKPLLESHDGAEKIGSKRLRR